METPEPPMVTTPVPAPNALAIEICFPMCRAELLAGGTDPTDLRSAIDAASARPDASDGLRHLVETMATTSEGPGLRLLHDVVGHRDEPIPLDPVRDAIRELVGPPAQGPVNPASGETSRQQAVRRLDEVIELAGEGAADLDRARARAAVVGRMVEEAIFEGPLLSGGGAVAAAVDMDCAARVLAWVDRLDKRGGRPRAPVLRDALGGAWDAITGSGANPDRRKVDRRLKQQFVDTARYADDDWVAWLASRAVDTVYAAVGSALGRRSAPTAVSEARGLATDLAAIGREMPPWDLGRTLATAVDPPVLAELTAQLRARALAINDVESLRRAAQAGANPVRPRPPRSRP